MSIRTFIALEIPLTLKETINRIQSDLRLQIASTDRVSWVAAGGIHLTLKFLGDVQSDAVEKIRRSVESASLSSTPFQLGSSITGAFPNLKRPRVLWIGIEENEALSKLQKEIDRSLSTLGFPPDGKRFHPHLTVCRIRRLTPDSPLPAAFGGTKVDPVSWRVGEILVMKSTLRPGGGEYARLAVVPLERSEQSIE